MFYRPSVVSAGRLDGLMDEFAAAMDVVSLSLSVYPTGSSVGSFSGARVDQSVALFRLLLLLLLTDVS